MSPLWVSPSSSPLARPKSAIQTTPAWSRRRLLGLMSRWTRPRAWAYASPCAAWRPICATFRKKGARRPERSTVETWPFPGSTAEGAGAAVGPGRLRILEHEVRAVDRVSGQRHGRGRAGRGVRRHLTSWDRCFGREPATEDRLRDPAERGVLQAGNRSGRLRPRAVRPSRRPLEAAQPRQLVDDLVQPLALDELHRVVGHLAVAA